MENSLEYVGIWLGLSKIGVISSLINSKLKYQALVHCINASGTSIIIFSSPLEKCKLICV